MSKPYVYRIESLEQEFYFGVRWDYIGNPIDDLWINYFTSSSLIKEIIFKKGLNYFKPQIIKIFENKRDALDFEYNLIRANIEDNKCLNRALGKCTIWDETLKKQVSNSMKKICENEEIKNIRSVRVSGNKNPNYQKNPWRNVNSNVQSWLKIIEIYNDFVSENWDFTKYGTGREYLMKRYKIAQGTARTFIRLIKNNWNPFLDGDFLLFLNQNTRVS